MSNYIYEILITKNAEWFYTTVPLIVIARSLSASENEARQKQKEPFKYNGMHTCSCILQSFVFQVKFLCRRPRYFHLLLEKDVGKSNIETSGYHNFNFC